MNCERCDDDREATERLIAQKNGETLELILCTPHNYQERKVLAAAGWTLELSESL